ncbi:hypothetical protein Slin15195_G012510 [Septoria linicola]|uniref:Uncharacterized protein n=1 Tax=Septoria linicola TaxID=215465 RepID=A0A9Q9AF77_9PEZI|nr:hypothetical protein Slin14017_G012530 [Septoria linicola]USW47932.1 hypothetical protein Slin15195_G012510 [Septoria linicola]
MELRKFAVCRDCLAVLRQSSRPSIARGTTAQQQWTSSRNVATTTYTERTRPRTRWQQQQHWPRITHASRRQLTTSATTNSPQPPKPYTAPDLNKIYQRVQELSASVLQPEQGGANVLPAEERVLYVLEQLEYLAKLILDERGGNGGGSGAEGNLRAQAREQKETATSALLGSVNARSYPAFMSKASILNVISERAEEMLRHPAVFIAPAVLRSYVQLQGLLHQPSSFPDVFDLYARKPVPSVKGSEIVYSPSAPDQIKSAVPSDIAKDALAAAIQAHQLPLAIDIISTSYCTSAFKKAKTFRQAAFPMTGLVVAPVAAYTLSTQFSHLQQTMDTGAATGIAFAGIMTYVGAVAMTGYVAVTTSNDQMDRVTWASGVPLWERWVREEERAAIDQLAGAWGFKDLDKRGEEEGEEWEALREWVGSRGMILDRVSLMPGME